MVTTDPHALDALPTTAQGFSRPDPAWVAANRKRVRLVDIREPSEWVSELRALPDAERVRLSELGHAIGAWDKDEPIVLLCRSGGRSDAGAAAMVRAGFTKVGSMAGGMGEWYRRGL